jgi:hypothetical protein
MTIALRLPATSIWLQNLQSLNLANRPGTRGKAENWEKRMEKFLVEHT